MQNELEHYLIYHQNDAVSFGECDLGNRCIVLLKNNLNIIEEIHLVFYQEGQKRYKSN